MIKLLTFNENGDIMGVFENRIAKFYKITSTGRGNS